MIALAVATSELLVQEDSDGILGMYHGKPAGSGHPWHLAVSTGQQLGFFALAYDLHWKTLREWWFG